MAKPLIRNSKSTDQLSAEQSVCLSACLSAQLPPRSPPHPVIDQNHPYRPPPPPLPRIFPARAMFAGRAAASASAEEAVDEGALMETAAAVTRRSVKWCFIELLCTRAWSGDGGRRMGPLKRHHSGPDRRTGTGHRIGDADAMHGDASVVRGRMGQSSRCRESRRHSAARVSVEKLRV